MKFMVSLVIILIIRCITISGAIKDSLLEEHDIAKFLLALLNLRKEYRDWDNLNRMGDKSCLADGTSGRSQHTKRQYSSDHTQVKCMNECLNCSLILISFKLLLTCMPVTAVFNFCAGFYC